MIWDERAEDPPGAARGRIIRIFSRLSEHRRSHPGAIARLQPLRAQFVRRDDAMSRLLDKQSMHLRDHLTTPSAKISMHESEALGFARCIGYGKASSSSTGANVPSPAELTRLIKRLLTALQIHNVTREPDSDSMLS